MASGGPIVCSGHESELLSTIDFWSSADKLIQYLQFEANQVPVDDEDIRVEDLKVVDDNEFVDRALQETEALPETEQPVEQTEVEQPVVEQPEVEQPVVVLEQPVAVVEQPVVVETKPKPIRNVKKRKRGGPMGRPSDSVARAEALRLDEEKAAYFTGLMKQRDARRVMALESLHSLRVKEEKGLIDFSARRLRCLGGLRSSSSTIGPRALVADETELAKQMLQPGQEVVLSVDYHNCAGLKVQAFLLLASQPLTALRDHLFCSVDELAERAGRNVPSGYFFIEDVIYNDLRHPEAIDYSENIIRWRNEIVETRKETKNGTKGKKIKLPQLRAASMEGVTFHDLKFRIGVRYLYCHQGDCKHLFVIRDVRLLHEEDERDPAMYPMLQFLPKMRHKKCFVCNIYRATKITTGDKLAPEDPCYFCDECFNLLHCSKEGDLLYRDFTVLDYFHSV